MTTGNNHRAAKTIETLLDEMEVSLMNRWVFALIISVGWLVSDSVATEYRCPNLGKVSAVAAVKHHKAVFIGEVIETKGGCRSEAKFKVTKAWKGVESREITVFAGCDAESPHYQKGKSYLVFAFDRDGILFTGQCSITKELARAQEFVTELEASDLPVRSYDSSGTQLSNPSTRR